MKLFSIIPYNKLKPTLYVQLGSGKIGSAIYSRVEDRGQLLHSIHMDWGNTNNFYSDLQELQLSVSGYNKIEIIWAAGKAGFSADYEEVKEEKINFQRIIEELQKWTKKNTNTRFWLMSSAGALFENQTCVNKMSVPQPLRPYAHLKLFQETLIKTYFKNSIICRISSVYSKNNLSGRLGLLSVLVRNGIQYKVTTITGNESTLRDYVLDEDIADFVVDEICSDSGLNGIIYLIHGAPLSIRMIINSIENLILQKLLINYSSLPSNAASISFSPNMKAPLFNTSSIQTNIKSLYMNILNNMTHG